IRPRLTASSTTSWMRSRLSVTLCSSESRNWAIDVSRPTGREEPFLPAALGADFGAALAVAFVGFAFGVFFAAAFAFALVFFVVDFVAVAFFVLGFSSAINAPSFGHRLPGPGLLPTRRIS